MEMLRDLDMDTVDFAPNYDGSEQEAARAAGALPEPARQRLPGDRRRHGDQIPPHNLREVIDATIAYIEQPQITVEDLMAHVKGPDFPTGGIILGPRRGSATPTRPGRGRVRVQARATPSR